MHRWVHEHRFPDSVALSHALSGEIQVDLAEAIQVRGTASLVVSGGPAASRLLAQLRNEKLDWPRLWVTLAGERWVETSSEESNERLVREHLLVGAASGARFVGLKNPAPTPEAGADWAWRALSRVPHPYDVVVLSMGEDGHIAALFPGSLTLSRALDPGARPGCVAINALEAPHAHLSLNLSALLDSRRIVLQIEGEAQWQVYKKARAAGATSELPVRAILHQQEVPVDVYWAP